MLRYEFDDADVAAGMQTLLDEGVVIDNAAAVAEALGIDFAPFPSADEFAALCVAAAKAARTVHSP